MNSILSSNIGYLNALRFAQPLPQMASVTPVSVPEPKNSNLGWGLVILVIGLLGILAFRNYHEAQEKKNK